MKIKTLIGTLLGFALLAQVALAAGTDVQLTTGSTIVLTVGSSQLEFTVTTGTIESMIVNAASVDLVLASGSGIDITSANKKTFSYGGASGITSSFTCNASSSVLSLSGSGSMTITPSEAVCSTSSGSSGSGSGGGGGGGGGSSTPTPEPTPTPAPAAATTPAPVASVAQTVAPVVAKPSQVAQLVSPVFNKDLKVGSKGDDVKRLQQLLAQDKEIYPEGQATGYLGNLTRNAIRKFQLKYGVIKKATDAGNGNLGPKTRAKLTEIYGSASVAPTPASVPTPAAAGKPAPAKATQGQVDQLQALLKQLQDLQAKLKKP